MSNSSVLSSLAVAGLSAASQAAPALEQGPTLLTNDQRRVDQAALAIVADPAVKEASAEILTNWSALPPAMLKDGRDTLPATVSEITYLAALTIAQQVLVPDTIISIETAPDVWEPGTRGSRWALDNPDRIYRLATVDPSASYIVKGRRQTHPSNDDFRFEATADGVTTLSALDGQEIDVAPDGSFQFVIDGTATNGRRNHLTLPLNADTIVIRDTLSNWATQLPNRLAIERVGGPSQPGTMEEAVRKTVALLGKYADLDSQWIASFWRPPVNQLIAHVRSSENGLGGTVNAASRFSLENDEALVVTIDPQGAGYVGFLLTNPWAVSLPYWKETTSLSEKQAVAANDGSITYVIAARDPGVDNWMSTAGLNDGIMSLRLENIPSGISIDPEKVVRNVSLVKLGYVAAAVPAGTATVKPQERAAQRAARAAAFARRRTD